MIEKIVIDGFKSLKKISLEIRPLTILIGLNSSGKSSVLQLLEVLKQSVVRVEDRPPQPMTSTNLRIDGSLINLGTFEDIVFQKNRNNEIRIEMRGKREQFLDQPFSRETIYEYSLIVDFQGIKYHLCTIKSGEITLSGEYQRGFPSKRIEIPFQNGKLFFDHRNYVAHPFEYGGASAGVSVSADMFNKFINVIREDLCDFFLIPAIRGMSLPSYNLDNISSNDLIDVSNLHGQAIKFSSTVVYEGPAIERKINKWIKEITGVDIRGRVVPDKRASIEASRKIMVNIVNEGFGTNQLVHLFAQIAKAPPFSLIGIEEPETHLHPRAQSDLARVLIEIAEEEKKDLILTTHSEHILYRLLIEVAKGNLKSKDLAIYHFRLSEEGVTTAEMLRVDEKGQLDKGIPDFLETDMDEFKDFLETLKARLK